MGWLYTLYLAYQIILPMVMALLTSLLLSPLVARMCTGLRIPKMISSLILVLLLLAAIAGVFLAVATPALECAGKAPVGILRLLIGESELKWQIRRVTESAQVVEESVTH
jgi:predicted PurR-regulated permease PerM